jgi:acyl carrier protein
MTLDEFVKAFAAEFEETPEEKFSASTEYKTLDEWGSLTALSIIAMVDENLDKRITGADLRSVNTVEELYNLVMAK